MQEIDLISGQTDKETNTYDDSDSAQKWILAHKNKLEASNTKSPLESF